MRSTDTTPMHLFVAQLARAPSTAPMFPYRIRLTSSASSFISFVRTMDCFPEPKQRITIQTPDAWLGRVATPAARAVMNGSTFTVVSRHRLEIWKPDWKIGDSKAQDGRIWQVTYNLIDTTENSGFTWKGVESIPGLILELERLLLDLNAFSERQSLKDFSACFRTAGACLHAPNPLRLAGLEDTIPRDFLASSAAQWLAACKSAWVFGVGSWNDLTFFDRERSRYRELSSRLSRILDEAICASVNSTAGSPPVHI
jgi:hypothetical protein